MTAPGGHRASDAGRAGWRRALENGWLVLATPLLPALLAVLPRAAGGWGAWLLPLLAPATVYPAFARRVRERDYFAGWLLGLAWALLLSVGVVLLVAFAPAGARAVILNGEPYRREMFGWIATGVAPENSWQLFVPQHLSHLALFLLLTAASGGYLGLVLGATLVGYMSYFVGSFAVLCPHPVLAAIAAWVPWSVLRVLAFVLVGALFSRPLLVRRLWPFARLELELMALAASGLAADIVIKALSARGYGLLLRQMAHGAVGALYSGALRIPG
ncbi:MAG TPA: hypothetical protein VHR45_12330 [Thermoanaerobaculia bacterium]|nr:hypothetical protein [Thermoanaerobaculia bacterium]